MQETRLPFNLLRIYKVEDNFQEIKDGSVLNLGKHTLKFYLTPMVHWPETMMTYDEKDKILFQEMPLVIWNFRWRDFDDEVRIDFFEDEIRRYFSNIIGKYTKMVQRALNKLKDANIDIDIIAATHGPVWRKDPKES